MRYKQFLIAMTLAFFFCSTVQVWGTDQVFRIIRTTEKIKIDGYINEKAWAKALTVPVNIEIIPGENIEAPAKTECLLLYDDKNIYVAFRALDPNPREIRAHLADHDSGWQDDFVAIILDTFNDQNRAFAFFSNPLGVQADEIFSDGGNVEDDSWDAIWRSGGHINEKGYEVEMAIPFNALQFPSDSGPQTWGFSPLRILPRSKRHRITGFKFNRNNSCFLCQIPKLKGITGVKPGKNVELSPTLTAYHTDVRKDFPDSPLEKQDRKVEPGLTTHWGLTPNLTLSSTINPDFSQVEADAAQLELNTQFALFYPEKRPFFLEAGDFFSTAVKAVHTRTLADPYWGVKLSGKLQKNAFGMFVSRDKITNLVFPGAEESETHSMEQSSTSSVFRVRRDLGKSSTIGVLVTDREGKDYFNRLAGVDAQIRINKSDTLQLQLLGSSTAYPGEVVTEFNQKQGNLGGSAVNFSYNHMGRTLGWNVTYQDFSPDFRADMGFVPQVNYRKGIVGGSYTWWGKKDAFFSNFTIAGNLDQTIDYSGALLEREAEINIAMEMPLQAFLSLNGGIRKKVYHGEPFNQKFLHGLFKTRPNRSLSLQFYASLRDDIDLTHIRAGKYVKLEPSIEQHIGKHIFTGIYYTWSQLKVAQGRLFSAHVVQFQFIYHLNRRAFFRSVVQYMDITRNLDLYQDPSSVEGKFKWMFTQFLFSYKLNPRTVLFLGYSDNHVGFMDVSSRKLDRTFFLKIGYALSL